MTGEQGAAATSFRSASQDRTLTLLTYERHFLVLGWSTFREHTTLADTEVGQLCAVWGNIELGPTDSMVALKRVWGCVTFSRPRGAGGTG